ncbi:MAG: cupin domain-containing protein [Gammaproteobacteria bacterium]
MQERASEIIADLPWRPSPDGSVDRRMLDRDGEEIARATSIVRYPEESRFRPHVHGGGEEFLVLDGIFSDENGNYGAGTYVRNPPGSSHAPFSDGGCTIFVKLQQFASDDLQQVVISTDNQPYLNGPHPGWSHQLLHRHGSEEVWLIRLDRDTPAVDIEWSHGAEFLILEGAIEDAQGGYPSDSWLRLPAGSRQRLVTKSGAVFYLKTGHLHRIECA